MQKNAAEIKVLITRGIPSIGIDLLKSEGFSVSIWPHDRPIPNNELISEAKKVNAVISLYTDKLDTNFLNECRHLDIISQFAVGYDNIDVAEANRHGIML